MTKKGAKSPGSGRRTFQDKEAMVVQAQEMRSEGFSLDDICDELSVSSATASRWVQGVRKPKTPKQIEAAGMKDHQGRKRQARDDRMRNRIDTDDTDEPPIFTRITKMPSNVQDYQPHRDDDTDELEINPRLLATAKAIITTRSMDEATGRLITVTDLEWHKACLTIGHAFKITDYQDFLTHRDHWRPARDFCEQSLDFIATRVGVSPASITRYERSDRSPDSSLWRTLHLTYKTMLDDQLARHEYILITYSYCDAKGITYEEHVQHEDIMEWYRTCDWSDITHLAQIRATIPEPTWRAEDVDLDGYWTPEKVTNRVTSGS